MQLGSPEPKHAGGSHCFRWAQMCSDTTCSVSLKTHTVWFRRLHRTSREREETFSSDRERWPCCALLTAPYWALTWLECWRSYFTHSCALSLSLSPPHQHPYTLNPRPLLTLKPTLHPQTTQRGREEQPKCLDLTKDMYVLVLTRTHSHTQRRSASFFKKADKRLFVSQQWHLWCHHFFYLCSHMILCSDLLQQV